MNGQEAIKKIEDKQKILCGCPKSYKLVIMDINMPVMDGIEATRNIKQMVEKGEIPPTTIIALSAQPFREEDREFYEFEVGFSTYITKPINKKDFLELVNKYNAI